MGHDHDYHDVKKYVMYKIRTQSTRNQKQIDRFVVALNKLIINW